MLHMILQLLDEVRARHTLVFILQYERLPRLPYRGLGLAHR